MLKKLNNCFWQNGKNEKKIEKWNNNNVKSTARDDTSPPLWRRCTMGTPYSYPQLRWLRTTFLQFLVRRKTNVPLGICVRTPGKFETDSLQFSCNIDMKMIRSWNSTGLVPFFAVFVWISWTGSSVVCPGKISTRTRPALRRFHSLLGSPENPWTILPVLPTSVSKQDVRESFQDKARNQSRYVPLLSTAWLLCHVAKSISSMELYSIRSWISRRSHFLWFRIKLCEIPNKAFEVDFRIPWSPPDLFHLRLGIWSVHLFFGVVTARIFWRVPKFPAPQCLRPKYFLSNFLPHTVHIQGKLHVPLSYQIGGVLTGGIPPWSRKESLVLWMVLQKLSHTVFFPPAIAHHFSFTPECDSTAEVPHLILRTAHSAIPFVSDRWSVDVQWFHDHCSQDLPNSKELSV